MHQALNILADLSEPDRKWIFQNATEQQCSTNARVITEGTRADAVCIVLDERSGPRSGLGKTGQAY